MPTARLQWLMSILGELGNEPGKRVPDHGAEAVGE